MGTDSGFGLCLGTLLCCVEPELGHRRLFIWGLSFIRGFVRGHFVRGHCTAPTAATTVTAGDGCCGQLLCSGQL